MKKSKKQLAVKKVTIASLETKELGRIKGGTGQTDIFYASYYSTYIGCCIIRP